MYRKIASIQWRRLVMGAMALATMLMAAGAHWKPT